MANQIAIKRRIRSVTSTRQITKAMQLVAASKLRAAATAATAVTRYRKEVDAVLVATAGTADWQQHALVGQGNAKAPTRIMIVASDRGLAGAYHSRLEIELRKLVETERAAGRKIECTVIGQRAAAMALRISELDIIGRYPGLAITPTMREMRPAAQRVLDEFAAGKIGRLVVLTTRFHSSLRQEAEAVQLLPLGDGVATVSANEQGSLSQSATTGHRRSLSTAASTSANVPVTLESDADTAITAAVSAWLQAALLDASVSAVASEHAMRMMAMQNATDNAGELIDELTLAYNTARQAAITQELAEISGGVAALT